MLETIREFALERLVARGDGEAVRRRHAAFYLVLAEEAEPGLLGPQQREWLERLDSERDNIRAALDWALDAGEAEVGLRIGCGALALLAAAEPRAGGARAPGGAARARLRLAEHPREGANDARRRCRSFSATSRRHDELLEESLPVHRRMGDARMISSTLGLLGWQPCCRRRRFGPRPEPGSSRGGSQGRRPVRGVLHPLARRCRSRSASGSSMTPSERSRRRSTSHARSEMLRSVGAWQKTLAGIAIMRGDHARAWRLFEESLAIHRGLDDAWGVSHSLSNLAFLALEAGDAETARTLLSEALAIERESGHQPRLANALEMSARLAAADGQPALATRLYARACATPRDRRDYGLHVRGRMARPRAEPRRSPLAGRRGRRFEEEWARGRAMSLLEADGDRPGDRGAARARGEHALGPVAVGVSRQEVARSNRAVGQALAFPREIAAPVGVGRMN